MKNLLLSGLKKKHKKGNQSEITDGKGKQLWPTVSCRCSTESQGRDKKTKKQKMGKKRIKDIETKKPTKEKKQQSGNMPN